MQILFTLIKPLEWINDIAGRLGRNLSVVAMGLMVVIILTQVFFRYALNNALPWPDEAARFLMLWLAGLMGPIAMRRGPFSSYKAKIRARMTSSSNPTAFGLVV